LKKKENKDSRAELCREKINGNAKKTKKKPIKHAGSLPGELSGSWGGKILENRVQAGAKGGGGLGLGASFVQGNKRGEARSPPILKKVSNIKTEGTNKLENQAKPLGGGGDSFGERKKKLSNQPGGTPIRDISKEKKSPSVENRAENKLPKKGGKKKGMGGLLTSKTPEKGRTERKLGSGQKTRKALRETKEKQGEIWGAGGVPCKKKINQATGLGRGGSRGKKGDTSKKSDAPKRERKDGGIRTPFCGGRKGVQD